MSPAELTADLNARSSVAVVLLRNGWTAPDGSRPIIGGVATVPGTVAVQMLLNGVATLAESQP